MLKNIMIKCKSIILYGFFGVITTVVNIISYYICAHILSLGTIVSNGIAWFTAVLFAYITNRKWVFESKKNYKNEIIKECISFFSCRLLTGFLDVFIMYVCVDILNYNDMIIKIISNILVIVLNYVASKMLVFR